MNRNTFGIALLAILLHASTALAVPAPLQEYIYNPGNLPATDSVLKLAPGDPAPDFSLPTLSGEPVSLAQFKGKKNVVLSFVPAAWTPVCSDQWPGYNIARSLFTDYDAVLIGITVDNLPTLHAWTLNMGELWFTVASDFWPHGAVADSFGLLRGDGTSERALVFINRKGIISNIHVSDINVRPPLEIVVQELEKMSGRK